MEKTYQRQQEPTDVARFAIVATVDAVRTGIIPESINDVLEGGSGSFRGMPYGKIQGGDNMHWLFIYIICAITASIIFCYIVLNSNKDYFKTHRWAGVFSIISMGAAFPLIVVVAIAKVVKAHYSTQERIRAALDRRDKIMAEN